MDEDKIIDELLKLRTLFGLVVQPRAQDPSGESAIGDVNVFDSWMNVRDPKYANQANKNAIQNFFNDLEKLFYVQSSRGTIFSARYQEFMNALRKLIRADLLRGEFVDRKTLEERGELKKASESVRRFLHDPSNVAVKNYLKLHLGSLHSANEQLVKYLKDKNIKYLPKETVVPHTAVELPADRDLATDSPAVKAGKKKRREAKQLQREAAIKKAQKISQPKLEAARERLRSDLSAIAEDSDRAFHAMSRLGELKREEAVARLEGIRSPQTKETNPIEFEIKQVRDRIISRDNNLKLLIQAHNVAQEYYPGSAKYESVQQGLQQLEDEFNMDPDRRDHPGTAAPAGMTDFQKDAEHLQKQIIADQKYLASLEAGLKEWADYTKKQGPVLGKVKAQMIIEAAKKNTPPAANPLAATTERQTVKFMKWIDGLGSHLKKEETKQLRDELKKWGEGQFNQLNDLMEKIVNLRNKLKLKENKEETEKLRTLEKAFVLNQIKYIQEIQRIRGAGKTKVEDAYRVHLDIINKVGAPSAESAKTSHSRVTPESTLTPGFQSGKSKPISPTSRSKPPTRPEHPGG